MKTEIFNLIILDESGSMSGVRNATIDGCNETLNAIRATQMKYADTQEHYESIFVFQENDQVPSRYLVKNKPIAKVSDINAEQYRPWGCTPLYDAIGSTLVDLKAVTNGKKFALGNVTIITDGYENASRQYTLEKITRMIDALKEIGWSFNFIGANIDVQATAAALKIDNAMEFQQTEEGTAQMFARERNARMAWADRAEGVYGCFYSESASIDEDALHASLREASANYFRDPDDDRETDDTELD